MIFVRLKHLHPNKPIFRLSQFYRENEFTSLVPNRMASDFASHLTNDAPADVQAKTNTLRVDLLCLPNQSIKAKKFALVLLLDADSIVSHTDNEHVVAT